MELKRKISLFFVFAAMAAVLGHALIPHCHHADGVYIMAHGHHHHCHHAVGDGTSQICENDHDDEVQEDCLSEKSFLKTSASEQIHHQIIFPLTAAMPVWLLEPISRNVEVASRWVPLDILPHYIVWLYGSGALRAPPLV